MSRENAEAKGRRYLTEGRLTVTRVLRAAGANANATVNWQTPIVAECRGDSGEVYALGYDAGRKEWRCTCEARSKCAHLVALQLVTTISKEAP